MALFSLSKCLAREIKSTCMTMAWRSYCRPVLCNMQFSKCQKDLEQATSRLKSQYKTNKEDTGSKNHITSLWRYPAECCANPCPNMLPRLDSLYYKPTNNAERQYQQTWVECKAPPPQRRRRNLCYESEELPPVYTRKRNDFLGTAQEFDTERMLAICAIGVNTKCIRLPAPGCKRGNYPPTCRPFKSISNCYKQLCPTPSFSEDCKAIFKTVKQKECTCVIAPSICEAARYMKRKLTYDLPPPLPALPA